MKRAIITSVRLSKDSQTGESNAWVTASVMPSKMKNGGVFIPKTSEIHVTTCAGELRSPDNFKAYKDLKIGDVVNIHYAVNEFNNKVYVALIEKVSATPYDENVLIV